MQESPRNKMIGKGDEESKNLEQPTAPAEQTFNFPALGITVKANSYEEALEIINKQQQPQE